MLLELKLKPWECTLQRRRDVKVLDSMDINGWHIELYEKDSEKGILIGNTKKGVCLLIPPEMPEQWKKENLYNNENLPKYLKKKLSRVPWIVEVVGAP